MRVLITGGAGFIGSHVAHELLKLGHLVRALDSLVPQVHSRERRRPAYLSRQVGLVVGDVRDAKALVRALDRVDAVNHLVALVGAGQRVYALSKYDQERMCLIAGSS